MRRAWIPVLALILAACGGGDEDEDAAAPSTSGGPTTPTTAVNLPGRVQTFPVASRNHVAGKVDYPQTPPVGGDHAGVWMNCGYYSQPVSAEAAVHSLEHGAIWITYRPDLARAQVTVLRDLARNRAYVLVSPWADRNLPTPVVASAWGLQLRADSATDPAISAFITMYVRGQQSPEPGAPCSGAIGNPE